MKIFYDPDTLEIKGASDGEDSLSFPSVETDETYFSLENLGIERDADGVAQLRIYKA